MKTDGLTGNDYNLIITSLEYTIDKFKSYRHYPSEEFKKQRIAEAKEALSRVRAMRKQKDS